ncbi:hypothetical protein JHK82_015897 [Glycine max]|nr:hypothetical protein JHK82_015897 [Glycine max]
MAEEQMKVPETMAEGRAAGNMPFTNQLRCLEVFQTFPSGIKPGELAIISKEVVGSVIKSPEISGLVPTLLKGLCHPKEHTKYSLNILLQNLSLARNNFSGPIPDSISEMASIKFLNLTCTGICLKLISLSGSDEHLERKILDPERLSRVESIFGNLSETIKIYGPWSSAWVGEARGVIQQWWQSCF